MALQAAERDKLKKKAVDIRRVIVEVTYSCGGTHIGGSLSQTDILVALYYKYLKFDPKNPLWEDRDRFVLSKGHGGVGHAAVLADVGFFPREDLDSFNKTGSPFGMHLDWLKVKGVDASTGSLGHGLAIGNGMAYGARLAKKNWHTYVVLGDGELNGGPVWESAMATAHFKLSNLTAFVDRTTSASTAPPRKSWPWSRSRTSGRLLAGMCSTSTATTSTRSARLPRALWAKRAVPRW